MEEQRKVEIEKEEKQKKPKTKQAQLCLFRAVTATL